MEVAQYYLIYVSSNDTRNARPLLVSRRDSTIKIFARSEPYDMEYVDDCDKPFYMVKDIDDPEHPEFYHSGSGVNPELVIDKYQKLVKTYTHVKDVLPSTGIIYCGDEEAPVGIAILVNIKDNDYAFIGEVTNSGEAGIMEFTTREPIIKFNCDFGSHDTIPFAYARSKNFVYCGFSNMFNPPSYIPINKVIDLDEFSEEDQNTKFMKKFKYKIIYTSPSGSKFHALNFRRFVVKK